MSDQERPFVDRVWEFTKDLSVRVSRKAEKHWKINTLRVEIASIKHRINVKYKELGRYVYESKKADILAEESYVETVDELYDELKRLEGEIFNREQRIEELEREMSEDYAAAEANRVDEAEADDEGPRPQAVPVSPPPVPPEEAKAKAAEETSAKDQAEPAEEDAVGKAAAEEQPSDEPDAGSDKSAKKKKTDA